MKKLLLSIVCVFTLHLLNAQFAPCDPGNWINVVPDSLVNKDSWLFPEDLSCVRQGIAYQEIVYFKVPNSAEVGDLGVVTIDSALLEGVSSLPPGLSYQSDKASNTWGGGAIGCVSLEGTTVVAVADYVPGIDFKLYINSLGTQDTTFNNFTLSVQHPDSCATWPYSVEELDNDDLLVKGYPQPANTEVFFDVSSKEAGTATLTVFNSMGRIVDEKNYFLDYNRNQLTYNLEKLPEGIYFYKMKINANIKTGNLLIQR